MSGREERFTWHEWPLGSHEDGVTWDKSIPRFAGRMGASPSILWRTGRAIVARGLDAYTLIQHNETLFNSPLSFPPSPRPC